MTKRTQDTLAELEDVAQRAAELAKHRGADDAEVLVRDGAELTAKVRLGEPEQLHEAGSRALGLRVFVDKRASVTYTSDLRPEPLEAFVGEAVELASLSEPDEFNTLPARDELATQVPDLDLYDPSVAEISAEDALERAKLGERAALDFDPRVTNSDGGTFSRITGAMALATTAGFCRGYHGTFAGLTVEPICDDEDGKKRNGHWWTASRFVSQLDPATSVGEEAARRTVAQLGARKAETAEVPVVFDPEAGRSIVGTVFGVANGGAFYRKSSYLVDREGTPVASPLVTIEDDPLIVRGPGSRPFDGEGLPTRKNRLVGAGVLETVLCDTYSARKLGRKSTGSASRGVGGSPGPGASNLIMRPGERSREDVLAGVGSGLYVTSMMGFGFNPVTGDFSRGASGFWIENGELTYPVTEVTISANFDDLLKRIDAVASDLDMRSSTACPTFRVSHMTVAGT